MIKHDISHIMESGKHDDIEKLKDLFECLFDKIKEEDEYEYKHLAYKVHKIAYGGHLGRELAEKWCMAMKNKDGTYGGHWTWEQTEEVRKQYAPQHDTSDFYAIMNMMYSDYYNPKFDTAIYIQLSLDWLNDKDVSGCKTLKYYMEIVK